MNNTDVREQSLDVQMQFVNQSDLQTYDDVVREPATKETVYKFPPGTLKETQSSPQHKSDAVVKRFVFWLKTAVVIAFLVAVAALVLAVITLVSRCNQNPSKDCAGAAGKLNQS